MQDLTSREQKLQNDLIEFRRAEALKMLATGMTMTQIAEKFKVEVSTISRDIERIRKQAKARQQEYIDNELPFQHKLAVAALDKVLEEAWQIFRDEKSVKAKLTALDIIGDAIMKKQAVLGDPEQIEKAIKLVSRLKKQVEEEEEAETE